MIFFEEPNVINLHNGYYLRVCDHQSQFLDRLGYPVTWISNKAIRKKLEDSGKLPLSNNSFWEYTHRDLLEKIANA